MMIPTSAGNYIRDEFVGSFVNEVAPGNWDPRNDKGVFAITQLCLTYWNAAAALAHGKSKATSFETVAFMAEWLRGAPAPFGPRYRLRAAAVYALFRHGLVHNRFPGELSLSACTLSWVLGRDLKSDEHLLLVGPVPAGHCRRAFATDLNGPLGRGLPRAYLGLKPDLLYDHSLQAFREFAAACDNDKELTRLVQKGVREAKLPRTPGKGGVAALVEVALNAPDAWP